MSSHKREQLRALRVKRREEITVDQAADLLYEDIVAAFVTQVTFVHHRANTLGLDLEANLPHENGINGNGVQQPGPSNGRVGTSNGFRSKYECPCPECGRVIAATRFAPHLENCLGMGRNASRAARRKAAGFYAAGNNFGSKSDTNLVAKDLLKTSEATHSATNSIIDEEGSDHDALDVSVEDDDDDWKGKKSRKRKPAGKRAPTKSKTPRKR